jgi:23S rRNA maturation mini-RNase III
MNRQRGLALSALLVWGVVITLVAILVIRVLPEVMDYYKIRQAVKAVAAESGGKTVAELRQAFGKYAEVEHIKTIAPAELDIFQGRESGGDCFCLRETHSPGRKCQPADRLSRLVVGAKLRPMTASRLEQSLGYTFHDRALLLTALTHRSYSSPHNERLEFLGDAILNAVIARCLFERYPMLPEGDLSRLRANLVRQDSLHQQALALALGDCLRLGEGEQKKRRTATAVDSRRRPRGVVRRVVAGRGFRRRRSSRHAGVRKCP